MKLAVQPGLQHSAIECEGGGVQDLHLHDDCIRPDGQQTALQRSMKRTSKPNSTRSSQLLISRPSRLLMAEMSCPRSFFRLSAQRQISRRKPGSPKLNLEKPMYICKARAMRRKKKKKIAATHQTLQGCNWLHHWAQRSKNGVELVVSVGGERQPLCCNLRQSSLNIVLRLGRQV